MVTAWASYFCVYGVHRHNVSNLEYCEHFYKVSLLNLCVNFKKCSLKFIFFNLIKLMFFMSEYSINFPIFVFRIPTFIMFLSIAANLKPLTVTFPSHHHNSSTVPLSTPTLWSPPQPYIAVPSYQAWRTSCLENKSTCYFDIM